MADSKSEIVVYGGPDRAGPPRRVPRPRPLKRRQAHLAMGLSSKLGRLRVMGWRRGLGALTHWCVGSLVRRLTGALTHWFDDSLT